MSVHQHHQQQWLQAPRSRSGGRTRTAAGGGDSSSPVGSEGARSELTTPVTALPDETPPPDDDGPGIVTRDLAFETRPVRRRKTKEAPPPGTHDVTFYVTIAFAVPMSITEEESGGDGRKLNYYHVEYRVFPDELVKADVVLFGHEAAKVFADSGQSGRSDYRNAKLWGDGDDLWVVWQQSYQAAVTDAMLMSLSTHRFELKVWDAKEKCSTKAKYDRTRNFKFPAVPVGRDERQYGVRGTLARLSRLYERKIPTRLWLNRPLPHETMAVRAAALAALREATEAAAGDAGDETAAGRRRTGRRRSGGASRSTQQQQQQLLLQQQQREEFGLYAVTKFDGTSRPQTFNKLTRLAGASGPDPDDFKVRQSAGRAQPGPASSSAAAVAPPATGRSGDPSGVDELSRLGSAAPYGGAATDRASEFDGENGGGGGGGGISSAAGKARGKRQVDPEWERNGRVRIELNLAALFTTDCVIERLTEPALNLEDAFVMLCISEPLLSDAQKESLNPMSIRVRSVQCMPLEPYGQQGLHDRCEPVYCQYTFFDQPLHRTAGREHGEKVVWDDVQVVLTGLKDPVGLCEYVKGPGFWLEIHDRDRRPEEQRLEPALFGDDLEDEKISSVGLVSAKRTQYGAFPGSRVRAWDPHGRARVDLSGLLHGQRLIEAEIPIQRCEPPSPLGLGVDADNRVPGVAGAVDGPTRTPLEAGDFTNSGATVKVMLQLARPLAGGRNRPARFGRIALTFDYHNVALLHRLRAMLRSINAAAFGLSSLPEHAIATALTSRKLEADSSGSAQQQQQQQAADETAVSGFHLADGRRHLFVVEGPAGQGVTSVWAAMQPRGPGDDLHVMFNADVTFSRRQYASLGLDFPCIRLFDRLEAILEQSVLYVRDTVPRDCFQCLSKLGSLLNSASMLAAVKSENFPTAGMLASLAKEFSVPVGIDDMIHMESGPAPPPQQVLDAASPSRKVVQKAAPSRPSQTAHASAQPASFAGLQRSRTCPDFVRANVRSVQAKSAAVADERRQRLAETEARRGPPATAPAPAHNYSTQALNSTELALAEVRRRMRPDRRYTYLPEYHAAGTVAPVDVKRLASEAAADSRARWLSPAGWSCPGHQTSADANVHSRRPDPARLDALAEPWSENDLHTAQLRPTVPGREPLKWPERHADLDLWQQPRGPFGREPHSIFPTGDVKAAEAAEVAGREQADWSAAVVVDSTRIRTHRRLPGTELTERGHNAASNQLDRLTGLLKDPAVKFGFIYPGVRDVPALAVHAGGGADQAARAYMPGDREGRSLAVDYLERPEHGRGFRLICDTKTPVHKRHAPPLTESERRAQLHATARSFLALPMAASASAKSALAAKQATA